MGVLARVVKRAVADLECTWEPILPGNQIHSIELETNPEFMQITAAPEIVILLAFEVNAPGLTGLISLCYPYFSCNPPCPASACRRHRDTLGSVHSGHGSRIDCVWVACSCRPLQKSGARRCQHQRRAPWPQET